MLPSAVLGNDESRPVLGRNRGQERSDDAGEQRGVDVNHIESSLGQQAL